MARLTAKLVTRGGRPDITRECATDPGYGMANRPVIRKILDEMKDMQEYDPRFDFRETGQDNLEPWQRRRNLTG